MQSFTHLFVGIGGTGARIVNSITADGIVKVTVNPAYYLLPNSERYEERLRNFFSRLPKDTFLWLVFEDKDVNHELGEIIIESAPRDTIRLAYVLTPRKELVDEKKPHGHAILRPFFTIPSGTSSPTRASHSRMRSRGPPLA
ncbi:hypothetical protein J2747_001424 [Thermococcus stetteri]|nr:hypothetical protein [Thermococcus stetteri]